MVQPLFKVMTIENGLQLFRQAFDLETFFKQHIQQIGLFSAYNRVLAQDICSSENIPGFNRSTMDGYALKAADTYGASDSLPSYLEMVGEIRMSEKPSFGLKAGQAVRISTGGMLPKGADAVVMIEYTDEVSSNMIEVSRSVAPWENVLREDEDIKQGEVVLPKGRRLRPQDIGLLAAIGQERVPVFQRPQVGIISTGDEVIPVSSYPKLGQIRDINSYSLGASIIQAGGIPHYMGIIADNEEELENQLRKCLEQEDIDLVLISGGSSVGVRDYTLKALNRLGPPGVLLHGLALKPGKPTIISLSKQKPFIGIPGHPGSAMIVFETVVKRIIADLTGEAAHFRKQKTIPALLESNISSDAGREEYIFVLLEKRDKQIYAIPMLGKSGMISSMAKADGYIVIGLDKEGLYQGEQVLVTLFE